jgi:ATP-dependent helicase HrpB
VSKIPTTGLPIEAVLAEIETALSERNELVLEAPPGAGKTTLVPLALLNQPWLKATDKIIMLEPRRMAARNAARRMAELLGEPVGQTVGYRIRLENKISEATRLEVITEGILTRWLQDDPSLEGIGLLIFDEFHERSLNSDLGLTLSLQGRSLFREEDQPLKLLVMSATLDGAAVASLMGAAPIVRSEGRLYPVDISYGQSTSLSDSIVEPVVSSIQSALDSGEGSVLVFLPGQGEIRRVAELLSALITDPAVVIAPLYGGLSLPEQQRAIQPAPAGQRKVVLATDIAETSLTIEGVNAVVDSGLSRKPVFDPKTGMTRLQTQRISQASSTQRAGRAGRLQAGRCFRLWSEEQQSQLAPHSTPEILSADMAPLVLQLKQWGIDELNELDWLDLPPRGPYQQAQQLLLTLGALHQDQQTCQLTAHGQQMTLFPTHPRLAHLLMTGARCGHLTLAADIAALLSERDPLGHYGADVAYRLSLLAGELPTDLRHKSWLQRVKQQSRLFQKMLAAQARHPVCESDLSHEQALGLLIASAYPDRIAKQRNNGHYQLSNGRTAVLAEGDGLIKQPWLAVAELGGRVGFSEDKIYLAASFDPGLFDSYLRDVCQQQTRVEWDEQADRFIAEQRSMAGSLVVRTATLQSLPAEHKVQALLALVNKRGLKLLPWNDDLRQWQARVELVRQQMANSDWPDVSEQGLLASMNVWLAPYIDNISHITHFQKLDLKAMLMSLLPWEQQQQLEQLAPERISVPSGSAINIDYLQSPPVLAVKLQEMFGCEQTPTVLNGSVPLLVHLLSPARRPLQVTQDLAGFWRSSYQQVKKEMKGRYPKHPWPDDPLVALPTRHVKHRRPR